MYLIDAAGKVLSSDLQTVLHHIHYEPDTPRLTLPATHNAIVMHIQAAFETEVEAHQAELSHARSRAGLGRTYVLQQLQQVFDSTSDPETRRTVNYLSGLFSRATLPRRCHNELNALRTRKLHAGDLTRLWSGQSAGHSERCRCRVGRPHRVQRSADLSL